MTTILRILMVEDGYTDDYSRNFEQRTTVFNTTISNSDGEWVDTYLKQFSADVELSNESMTEITFTGEELSKMTEMFDKFEIELDLGDIDYIPDWQQFIILLMR